MTPSRLAAQLRQIAQKIDNSKRPDRRLVARELKQVLATIHDETEGKTFVEVLEEADIRGIESIIHSMTLEENAHHSSRHSIGEGDQPDVIANDPIKVVSVNISPNSEGEGTVTLSGGGQGKIQVPFKANDDISSWWLSQVMSHYPVAGSEL